MKNDYQTSTEDGAEGFARYNSEPEYDDAEYDMCCDEDEDENEEEW